MKCPKCSASLPDWAQTCQFCGANVAKAPRPQPVVEKKSRGAFEIPKWVWITYYGISTWWVISGAYRLMDAFYVFGKPADVIALEKKWDIQVGPSYFAAVIAAITVVFGLGLILRIPLIRTWVNWISGLKLISGVFGLATSVMASAALGLIGLLLVIANILDIIMAAILIWMIGETDERAPNL